MASDDLSQARKECLALADDDELLALWSSFYYNCTNDAESLARVSELLDHPRASEFVPVPNSWGTTGLFRIANAYHATPEMIAKMVKVGVDPNAISANGNTALHECVAQSEGFRPKLFQALLDAGADPNLTNSYGVTPVMRAYLQGHPEALRMLKGYDIDLSIRTTADFTHVDYDLNEEYTIPAGSTLEDIARLVDGSYEWALRQLFGEEQ